MPGTESREIPETIQDGSTGVEIEGKECWNTTDEIEKKGFVVISVLRHRGWYFMAFPDPWVWQKFSI